MTAQPIELFQQWFTQAQSTEPEPERVALATVGTAKMPSVRMVLLKQVDERGFVFFTNFQSNKAKQLAQNLNAALCFYWPSQQRQVRVQGHAVEVSELEADVYFQTRSLGSQISAWASLQSQVLPDYAHLVQRVQHYTEKFADQPVPRPPYWSGFRIVPTLIEFWEAAEYRMHQRIVYQLVGQAWQKSLLYP